MTRYIDADKAIEWAKKELSHSDKEIIEVMLEEVPTADVQEVKHEQWEYCGADKRGRVGIFVCSACNRGMPFKSYFCPYCGAKMDGESK